MKKIAILQSNYLPWKGVFDIINRVDAFVFLEDVQYTSRDWRNRNRVYTKDGLKWITVPVKKTNRNTLIKDSLIDNSTNWTNKHYGTIVRNYSKALCFDEYTWLVEEIYLNNRWKSLSEFNIYTTRLIAKELGIETEFINSYELQVKGTKDDRLIDICKKLNATHYLSGPAAKSYIVPEKFENNNIKLEYMEYKYPRYNQLHYPFEHGVTILDLLFNCGSDASYYIWGWRENHRGESVDTL
ncbi:WbqC family protein [Wukongibacter baidiensis]|uniref:WbqC family protein n=1 Tax=Wukongibacter baidiensis TaxID=1723361 RepID=UPI003D7FED42